MGSSSSAFWLVVASHFVFLTSHTGSQVEIIGIDRSRRGRQPSFDEEVLDDVEVDVNEKAAKYPSTIEGI